MHPFPVTPMLELSPSFTYLRKPSSSSEKNSLYPHMCSLQLESKNHAVSSVSFSTCAIRSNSFVVTASGALISDKQPVDSSFCLPSLQHMPREAAVQKFLQK